MLEINLFEIIILCGLGFCFLIQMFYYWIVIAKPYHHIRSSNNEDDYFDNQPPVSVIVCVKNKYDNLSYFLPALLEQDYPEFEVIVVNDGTTEESETILTQLKFQYQNLYETHIPDSSRNISRKKLGITLGIKAAHYEAVLFTDPDSIPSSKNWISLMARHFQDKKTLVFGLSVKEKTDGFLSSFIGYDYLYSNLQSISLALLKHPYAADSRNLLYRKDLYTSEKQFQKYRFLEYGEDDLFIQYVATSENTAIELSPESVVETWFSDIRDYKRYKIKKAVVKDFYKKDILAFWFFEYLTRIGFYLFLAAGIISGISSSVMLVSGLSCFAIRLFSQLYIHKKTADELILDRYYFLSPIFDLMQPFWNMYIFFQHFSKRKDFYIKKI